MKSVNFKNRIIGVSSFFCLLLGIDVSLNDFQNSFKADNVGSLSYVVVNSTDLEINHISIDEIMTDEEEKEKLRLYILNINDNKGED